MQREEEGGLLKTGGVDLLIFNASILGHYSVNFVSNFCGSFKYGLFGQTMNPKQLKISKITLLLTSSFFLFLFLTSLPQFIFLQNHHIPLVYFPPNVSFRLFSMFFSKKKLRENVMKRK